MAGMQSSINAIKILATAANRLVGIVEGGSIGCVSGLINGLQAGWTQGKGVTSLPYAIGGALQGAVAGLFNGGVSGAFLGLFPLQNGVQVAWHMGHVAVERGVVSLEEAADTIKDRLRKQIAASFVPLIDAPTPAPTLIPAKQTEQDAQIEWAWNVFLTNIKGLLGLMYAKHPDIICFISYAWEKDPHSVEQHALRRYIDHLVEILHALGITVIVDSKNLGTENIKNWMTAEINKAHYVCLICSPTLKEKVDTEPNSNIAFEVNTIKTKLLTKPHCLIPLLYQGEHKTACPEGIDQSLIRDGLSRENFYRALGSLDNPLGIIPALFGLVASSTNTDLQNKYCKSYRNCWEFFCLKLDQIHKDRTSVHQQATPFTKHLIRHASRSDLNTPSVLPAQKKRPRNLSLDSLKIPETLLRPHSH